MESVLMLNPHLLAQVSLDNLVTMKEFFLMTLISCMVNHPNFETVKQVDHEMIFVQANVHQIPFFKFSDYIQ